MRTAIQSIKSILFRISDLTPEKKALTITSGFYLGLFPLTGITTILCQIAAFKFKLNAILIHGINLVLAPVQILLMYPIMKMGRVMFFNDHRVIPELKLWNNGAFSNTEMMLYISQTLMAGMVVWSIFTVATGYFFYLLLLKMISR